MFGVGWVLVGATVLVSVGIQTAAAAWVPSWMALAIALLLAEALILLLAARGQPGLRPKASGPGNYFDALQLEQEQLRAYKTGSPRVKTTWLWLALPPLLTALVLITHA